MAKAYAPYYNIDSGLMGFTRRRGLGDTATQAADVTKFLTAADGALTKAGVAQNNGTTTQNDVGKAALQVAEVAKVTGTVVTTAGSAALAAGTTLAEISPAFGPLAPEVLIIAAVVVVAALLISKYFGGSKPITPTINDYNDQLRDQITTVDDQTQKVTQALQRLGEILRANGLGGLISVPRFLGGSETVTPGLQAELDQKLKNLQALITTFNTTVNQTYAAITGKSTGQKYLLYAFIGLTLLGITWFGVQELTDKK